MASPFPGMDPYLEDPAFWPDFHHRFIDCWCEAVADELPESYEARLDELEEVHETRIDILHRPERHLVGVLEMLSPTNKSGDGFLEYRAKRKAILQQSIHLVELDLLLGGSRMPLLRPLPGGDYFALVSRRQAPELRGLFLAGPGPPADDSHSPDDAGRRCAHRSGKGLPGDLPAWPVRSVASLWPASIGAADPGRRSVGNGFIDEEVSARG